MSPAELRREAMRCLRDVSPNVDLAVQLLAEAEHGDEQDRRRRRAHAVELNPEFFCGDCRG